MTSLTIIIPFLKETATELFEETLASVLEYRPPFADILVVNAAGYDDCWQISDEGVGFCHADPSCGLIESINIGIQHSQTPFVHPILCGCRVEEGWADGVMARFEKPNVSAVVPMIQEEGEEKSAKQKRIGLAYLRSGEIVSLDEKTPFPAQSRFAPTLGGVFFRREPLIDLGLLDEDLDPRFVYVDMALLLNALGGKIVSEKNSRIIYERNGLIEPSRAEWITAQETLFWRWFDFGGGTFKTKRLHAFRLWKEGIAAFFRGERVLIRAAYKAGRIKTGARERKKKIASARTILLARRKGAA